MMIAPYVHPDVVRFFKFECVDSKVKLAPININRMVGLVGDSEKVKDFCENFDIIVTDLLSLDKNEYADKINTYTPSKSSYIAN